MATWGHFNIMKNTKFTESRLLTASLSLQRDKAYRAGAMERCFKNSTTSSFFTFLFVDP